MTPARRAVALAVLLLALPVAPTRADPQTASLNLHQWGSVTLFTGLPSDHVRAIAQDAEGVLWLGTDGGLARFDGRRTQTVASAPVRALARDAGGTIWVGAEGGASRIVRGELVPVPGTEGRTITALADAGPTRMVLASDEGEVLGCATADGSVATTAAEPATSPSLTSSAGPLSITSVAATGHIFVGTVGRGLLMLVDGVASELVVRPRSYFVRALAVDETGRLYVGTAAKGDDGGVFDVSDLVRQRRLGSGTGTVNALAVDAEGDVWAGTDERGAIRYHAGAEAERLTFEGSAGGLRSNRVYAVFVDREGVVWFGTDRGACRYDPGSPRVDVLGADPDPNFVRAVLRDRAGRTWCGTNRGLFVREGDGPWRATIGAERRVVYALAETSDGTVLAGTGGSLLAIGRDERAAPLVADLGEGSGGVRAIRVANGRTIVATYGRGLARLDGDRLDYFWPSAGADPRMREVVSLSPDGPDRAIVGTAAAGGYALDGASVAPSDALAPFAADAVWATARDDAGVLWVATGRGLFASDAPSAPVLDGVDARCVLATKSAVWCGTTAGGAVAVRRDGVSGTVVSRLDTEHGLPSNGVFALAACGACPELLVATSKGLVTYRPDAVAPGLRVARAFGARAYETGEVERGLSLEYPQNGLALEVAATSSRTFPEQFQYAFAVFDERGRRVASRVSHDAQLVLDGLAPGAYRVEARAYSTDLVASDPVAVAFRVERAPFPRGVAALSLLLAVALVALWWGAWQNRRLTGVNRELCETRSALARETETERRRIARDLHDQTLADLRRLLLVADEEHAGGPLRSEIEAISTEIRRICEDLSPSVLTNVGLTAALEWALADAVAHMPEGKKFEYAFECSDEVEDGLRADAAEWIQVYRIVQEAVANVCRHADASRVVLSARLDGEGALVVDLEDDGRGFDAREGRASGRGLGNIRSRASMIGATVAWSRREAGGTRFRLSIPVR